MPIFYGNPPPEVDTVVCDVCGFPGVPIDNDEPETAAISRTNVTDGSVDLFGNPLISVVVRAGSGCPLCGSPLYKSGGRRGDL
jgi:hypothetical protein